MTTTLLNFKVIKFVIFETKAIYKFIYAFYYSLNHNLAGNDQLI